MTNKSKILQVLKDNAGFVLEKNPDGSYDGAGAINRCKECKDMSLETYLYSHYPQKKANLEALPWTKVVENPRSPKPEEYPTKDGDYLVMLDADEHWVMVNTFHDGHWVLYNKTHVKWWMPISELELPSKDLINQICQLFMEHEAIEKYDPNAIDWIHEQLDRGNFN